MNRQGLLTSLLSCHCGSRHGRSNPAQPAGWWTQPLATRMASWSLKMENVPAAGSFFTSTHSVRQPHILSVTHTVWHTRTHFVTKNTACTNRLTNTMLFIQWRPVCIFSRTDYCGRGELADRQQKLGQMMAMLKKVRAASTPEDEAL